MASQDAKSGGSETLLQLVGDPTLHRFVEIGEDEMAAQDQIEWTIVHRPAAVR